MLSAQPTAPCNGETPHDLLAQARTLLGRVLTTLTDGGIFGEDRQGCAALMREATRLVRRAVQTQPGGYDSSDQRFQQRLRDCQALTRAILRVDYTLGG